MMKYISSQAAALTKHNDCLLLKTYYRKTSSISRTKSQSLNDSCILLQLSSLNPLKPGVKLITQM